MKVFYSAYTCKGNIGDLLITKLQIEEYAKYGEVYVDCHGMPVYFQQVIFDTQSPNVKNFEKEFGIYYRSYKILKVLLLINKENFTHFCSSPGPRIPLKMPLHKLCFKLMGALIPQVFLKKRIKKYALGVDLSYKTKGCLAYLNQWYFNRLDVIGVRSLNNLQLIQPFFKNVRYVPDMAFLYPGYNPDYYLEHRKSIALSFRKIDDHDALVNDLKSMLGLVHDQGISVDIIYQVEEDYDFCNKLYHELSKNNVCFVDKLVVYESLSIYKDYDIVISNRLHVLLMAALNGAIPYALISHNKRERKIKDIFDCVFSDQFVNFIKNDNNCTFKKVLSEKDTLKLKVRDSIEKQRLLCSQSFQELLT